MKKNHYILLLTTVLSVGLYVGYVKYKENEEDNKNKQSIAKIDNVLKNYATNFLKCDDEKTLEQYKSMIRHYNIRVVRHNRKVSEDKEFFLLDEEVEMEKIRESCKKVKSVDP